MINVIFFPFCFTLVVFLGEEEYSAWIGLLYLTGISHTELTGCNTQEDTQEKGKGLCGFAVMMPVLRRSHS